MPNRTWMTYPIPLQETGEPVLAQLTVPTDLTRVEAGRITAMIDALVLTVREEAARAVRLSVPVDDEGSGEAA